MRSQTVVWTALPSGRAGSTLRLSVLMMPRLQTDEGGPTPRLSLFPDFANWPATIGAAPAGPLAFTVSFGGGPPVNAAPDPASPRPSAAYWAAVFDPATTLVQPWQFYDYANVPLWSFSASAVEAFLRDAYKQVGQQSPTAPFPARQWLLDGPFAAARPEVVGQARRSPKGSGARTLGTPPPVVGGQPHEVLAQVLDFHTRPPLNPDFRPPVPTLDFHEALSMLKAYPRLMRMLGLVFDLLVPAPTGGAGTTTVRVAPVWRPLLAGPGTRSQDATPFTNCTLGSSSFRAAPRGADYGNGMLDLGDPGRFSVIEVDVDGGAELATGFAATLEQTIAGGTDDTATEYAPPALRSLGLSVVWAGWSAALNRLAAAQSEKQYQLERSLRDPANVAPPAFDAEDLVRGHRFDVLDLSDPSPAWRSLVGRVGSYGFPRNPGLSFPHEDEGVVVTGATQVAGTVEPPLPDLYVHETITRWSGWSLAARRPGRQILPGQEEGVGGDPGNPVPPASGEVSTPQLSATFAAPIGSLPKLRFGHRYRFRARAADLVGNGPLPSSDDDSTATAPVAHLRFDPVVAPAVAPDAPFGPGQGTQLLAVLNHDDDSPVVPRGLWLFPPRASQLLAEEHGMFDGFTPGQPPDPARGPSPDPATYNLIVAREHASLEDGGLPGFAVDPARNTPYFATAKLTTPWLPDPLSAGVAMRGLPAEPGQSPVVRGWAGGPWPDLEPVLLRLSGGDAPAHAYEGSTPTSSPVEQVTLPPAGVADVALSSSLPDAGIDLLGLWPWVTENLDLATFMFRRVQAATGQLWLLTPFRVVRLVHAVQRPLVGPALGDPQIRRDEGSTTARIDDARFVVDAPSTGTVDVEATWTDPLDDPTDPANDPSEDTVSRQAHAFQLTVNDPSRPGPPFAFDEEHGAVHDLGDTKHHRVTYTCTGASRFAELFRKVAQVTFSTGTPVHVSDLGLDPGSVRLTAADGAVLVPGTDFGVDAAKGDVTLLKPGVAQPVAVSYVPSVTRTGPGREVEVLASARPEPPKVARIVPAWDLIGPAGSLRDSGIGLVRTGGFLRVYLERPWHSSGAGELLGVVTLPDGVAAPTDRQRSLVTLAGRDPITATKFGFDIPLTPRSVTGTTTLPANVPGRPPYAPDKAVVGLAEDPDASYDVWPFEVRFDSFTNLWFADVAVTSPFPAPLPRHFVRLALVRLQPFAIPRAALGLSYGVEVSPVVLAPVAQPLPERSVLVELDPDDPDERTVLVHVEGPAYSGFRRPHVDPRGQPDQIQRDSRNTNAEHPDSGWEGGPSAPEIIADVQVRDTSSGLTGDLAWVTAPSTESILAPQFDSPSGRVRWGQSNAEPARGRVRLPFALSDANHPMRLRVTEVEFDTTILAPPIDASIRRPFVAFIPLS